MIRRLLVTAALGSVLAAGCRHKCCLNDPGRTPRPYLPAAPNSPFLLPPAGVPTTPGAPPAGSFLPPVGPGPGASNFPPPVIGTPPAKPAPEVLLPDPIPGSPSSKSMFPPDAGFGVIGKPPVKAPTAEPPTAPKIGSPVGLPGFARVKDGVASGRKPTLDGFDALKRAGYRTVVYLHPAGADVSAVRDVATGKGLAFVPVETTPEKLAGAVAELDRTVADRSARPVYVCDDDGVRAGAAWYVYFRTAEAMNDDAARVRARPLGLTDQGDEAKAFAVATQRILEAR